MDFTRLDLSLPSLTDVLPDVVRENILLILLLLFILLVMAIYVVKTYILTPTKPTQSSLDLPEEFLPQNPVDYSGVTTPLEDEQ